jgi:hypothetical protein
VGEFGSRYPKASSSSVSKSWIALSGAVEGDDCDCKDVELCKDEVFEVEVEIFEVDVEIFEVEVEIFRVEVEVFGVEIEVFDDERDAVFDVPAVIDLGIARRRVPSRFN